MPASRRGRGRGRLPADRPPAKAKGGTGIPPFVWGGVAVVLLLLFMAHRSATATSSHRPGSGPATGISGAASGLNTPGGRRPGPAGPPIRRAGL